MKVHLLVSELYIYKDERCNDKNVERNFTHKENYRYFCHFRGLGFM